MSNQNPAPLKSTLLESEVIDDIGGGIIPNSQSLTTSSGPNLNHQTVVYQHSNQSHQTFPLHHTVHSQELTETESIAMDIMGLFNESSVQGTEKSIDHLWRPSTQPSIHANDNKEYLLVSKYRSVFLSSWNIVR